MPENEIIKVQERHENKIENLQEAMYTLIEAQKNTTRNVDHLAEDVKEMLKSAGSCAVVESKIVSLEKRTKVLEDSKTWGFRLIIGGLIMSIIGVVSKLSLL